MIFALLSKRTSKNFLEKIRNGLYSIMEKIADDNYSPINTFTFCTELECNQLRIKQ